MNVKFIFKFKILRSVGGPCIYCIWRDQINKNEMVEACSTYGAHRTLVWKPEGERHLECFDVVGR
jgi:hypothetical protein